MSEGGKAARWVGPGRGTRGRRRGCSRVRARSAPASGATAGTRATRARAASRRCWSARRRPARTTPPASRASGASAASAGQVRGWVWWRGWGWGWGVGVGLGGAACVRMRRLAGGARPGAGTSCTGAHAPSVDLAVLAHVIATSPSLRLLICKTGPIIAPAPRVVPRRVKV